MTSIVLRPYRGGYRGRVKVAHDPYGDQYYMMREWKLCRSPLFSFGP